MYMKSKRKPPLEWESLRVYHWTLPSKLKFFKIALIGLQSEFDANLRRRILLRLSRNLTRESPHRVFLVFLTCKIIALRKRIQSHLNCKQNSTAAAKMMVSHAPLWQHVGPEDFYAKSFLSPPQFPATCSIELVSTSQYELAVSKLLTS